ncbi:MAG: NFACT RNA binding domain-containing protein [Gudongella sp.]|nr:NFACT RNA binding domain-containing protein [Gudongella sp.]
MSYDGITTRAIVHELSQLLIGGRIDKIHQQEKDELLIQVYSNGKNYKLLLSASSNNPRLYITNESKKNPLSPPMFCMLLRKHITSSIILNIEQYKMDRVVVFTLSGFDELGNKKNRELIIEIMGKHSNIILVDKESHIILDSIKRVPLSISRVRQILPGLQYLFIDIDEKSNPIDLNLKEFKSHLEKAEKNQKLLKFLYGSYMGLSPLISREICFLADLESNRTIISLNSDSILKLYDAFSIIMTKVNNNEFEPMYISREDTEEIIAFYAMPLKQYGNIEFTEVDSISALLDYVYSKKDTFDRVIQKSANFRKMLVNRLERSQKKLANQKEDLLNSRDREKYKIYADLLQSSLHKIPKGSSEILLENYYDENLKELLVPLDSKVSAAENAQNYYKKYAKLKTANRLLLKQIPDTQAEIDYIEHVIMSIVNSASVEDLEEIKEELIIGGYITIKTKSRKKIKEKPLKPLHFISSDNFHIYVGKNSKQNEFLTMKIAKKEDIWFHTKGIPGSHVILKTEGKEIPESTMLESAILAAFYSSGRNSSSVEVDYTDKKYVRKPKNAKTGMVIYTNQKTLLVNPQLLKSQEITKVED